MYKKLQLKKKIELCSKLVEDQHNMLITSFRSSWSVHLVREPYIESWSQPDLQMDKILSWTQQGLSQLPGTSMQEGWMPDSISVLQGSKVWTSDPLLKVWKYVGEKKKKKLKRFNFWNYCSLWYFGYLTVFINFVIIYWRQKIWRWNLCQPTAGSRIVIIYIFVALGYQLLFTDCMWS